MTNPFDDTAEDSYNPFASGYHDTNQPQTTSNYTPPPQNTYQPPPSQPTQQSTAINSDNPYGNQTTSTISKAFVTVGSKADFFDPVSGVPITQADLDRREAALNQREQAIQSKEQAIQNGTYVPPTNQKNFPPLIKVWAYHPDEDLPANAVKLGKLLFYIWGATGIIYFINAFGCLCCLNPGAAKKVSSPATLIILSLVVLLLLFPLSYEVGYFVFYKALVQGKALKFICFLVVYAIWFVILAIETIGFEETGSVGFITTINLFGAESGKFAAVIGLIFSILAAIDCVAMVYTFGMCVKYYKNEGIDKKAMNEASVYAAQAARDNQDVIIDAARENPDLVYGAATTAYNYA